MLKIIIRNMDKLTILLGLGVVGIAVIGIGLTALMYDMTEGFGFTSPFERMDFLWWFYVEDGRDLLFDEVYGQDYGNISLGYLEATTQNGALDGNCSDCRKLAWKPIAYRLYKLTKEVG